MGRDEGQEREQRRRATKDGASTDVPIAPGDASDGRVSGLVFTTIGLSNCVVRRPLFRGCQCIHLQCNVDSCGYSDGKPTATKLVATPTGIIDP